MNSSTWKTLVCAASLFVLAAAPTGAQTTDLFISEYIEGSSNNKAIEIYNGTGAAIDLAAGGYKIQMYFNGAVTPGTPINLVGTVAAGDVFVLAHASANATILAQADQTSSVAWYNGDDVIVLLKGSTVLDVVGQIGFDPGTEWGTGLTSTADNTLRRKSTICAGDTNGADVFDPSVEWDGYAVDTFGGLGSHTANCASNATITLACGSTLYVPFGSSATRNVTASDADGIVTSLDLTSVTPTPAAGTISRPAFTPASSTGGTATATIAVDSAVAAGSYTVLMSAANNDTAPQTGTCSFMVAVTAPIEIWAIQGSGLVSPYVGQVVTTNANIVTALAFSNTGVANGFFIQTPDARADADVGTSNGILVYTGSVPAVQVGDQVDVTGTVTEYFEMTELTSPIVAVTSSGNPLPAATLLGEVLPGVFVPSRSQPWPAIELERFEGMVVRVENGRASAPTDSFGDIAVVAYASRAYREPGMAYPGELGYTTLWDANPEIFEINPDGAGLPNVALPAGSVIQVAQGPLAYSFSDYQIWPTTFAYTAATLPRAVRARHAGEMTVASQNMLQFLDANAANGPSSGTPTPQQYQDKLAKASLHIRTVLGAPDVLALEEVENIGVLTDLAARIAADDATLVYSAYLFEGHDVGGIDVGFLVRDTVSVDSVTQVGYNTLLSLDGSYLNDRPPLVLRGSYIANGAPFPITVIGVHGRSLNGIEGNTADANRVRQKRLEQSLELANYIQSIQTSDPTRRVIVAGDFNAFQFSDGYVDVVGIISGTLDPNGAIQAGHADVVTPDLVDLVNALPAGERYSFVFDGSAQVLDHTLVTTNLATFVRGFAFSRGNADAPATFKSDPSTPLYTSDHDGSVLFIMTDADADGVPDDLEHPTNPGSDFGGDLKSDLLWRHVTLGEVWLWPMDGATRTAESYVRTVSDTNWEIRGIADFTGDGKADILWRHKITGAIYLWPMDGTTPLSETYVATVDPGYDVVGTGDFDGDGKADILWRHATLGEVWIWRMNGATPLDEVYVDWVDPAYLVKGVGDLDRDGKADIVWHHATAGEVWVWLMNGTARRSATYTATVPDLGYEIVGVADHTGDGKADILWHHATAGEVWLWPMDGSVVVSETYVATVSPGYDVAGTGDYDGDGKADILWHHATTGEVWVWLMDGATRLSQRWVATLPDVGYRIVR
jgi:uncharacterized protein